MERANGRQNTLGYDIPYHRDWLFVLAVVLAVAGGVIRLIRGDAWWVTVASVVGGVFLIGVVIGSLREFVRGLRQQGPGD